MQRSTTLGLTTTLAATSRLALVSASKDSLEAWQNHPIPFHGKWGPEHPLSCSRCKQKQKQQRRLECQPNLQWLHLEAVAVVGAVAVAVEASGVNDELSFTLSRL